MDAYAVLGVARGASEEEIRRAYQRLARLHHPDKQVAGDDANFLELQAAYEQLRDTRRQHDTALQLEELADAQAAARATTVDLSEMDYSEDVEGRGLWSYDCRCGDVYELSEAQLLSGIDALECRSCSLAIRPLYQQASDAPS
jgi:diphthamide biosynthesis protein 4|tara:strand:+ start:2785 stop:3213 length:429 start_codon:yes stop_codon:yes gene_type:complete